MATTIQRSWQRPLGPLLLLLLWGLVASSHATGSGSQLEEQELLPSDVPVTMMDRINSISDYKTGEQVSLETKLGTIVGLEEETLPPHYDNTHMHAFRGIPFAESPTGNLRFADPVDLVQEWPEKQLNATKFRSFCPQYNVDTKQVLGNEDCLYLNVYTPSHLGNTNRAKGELLPVFVFIHGGAFMRGSSSSHGAQQLLSRDIVVVTLNYRLGALGFLSTGDAILPGNYGILDQISALHWVQRNIDQFGGNPDQVTLGGFSAGASSVHFHMASPLSENLFNRGIMMSNAASCFWTTSYHPEVAASLLAEKLGCHTNSSQSFAKCLSDKTFQQIVQAQASMHKFEFNPNWFGVVVDGGLRNSSFLPARIDHLTLRPTPTIVGSLPHEGLMFAANVIALAEHPENVTSVYDEAVREIFKPWPNAETFEDMTDLAEAFYFDQYARTSKAAFLEQMTEAIGDTHFTHCILNSVSAIAETGAPVYNYLMTHRDPETPTWASPMYDRLRALGYDSPILQKGISHGDDLIYIFTFPYGLVKGSERDQKVNQILLQMITNFIVSGSPQENMDRYSLTDIPKWEQVKPNSPLNYYDIGVNPTMVHMPFKSKVQNFWNSMVPDAFPRTPSNMNMDKFSPSSLHEDSLLSETPYSTLTCSTSSDIDSCPP